MVPSSFVDVEPNYHFPNQSLPFCVFRPEAGSSPRPGVAIGDFVLDLSVVSSAGLFDGPLLNGSDCFHQAGWTKLVFAIRNFHRRELIITSHLNKFLTIGRPAWKEARATLQKILSSTVPILCDNANLRSKSLIPTCSVEMLLPIAIGDCTDFFSSMYHAKNCGTIFCGRDDPIPPNWFHLSIVYHGRASSVVIFGTNIIRPRYWTITQQLAHHTINGCNLRPGYLLGTGTISGSEPESYGRLLELTWNGRKELAFHGTTRKFLQDGDEVTITGFCEGDVYILGFGKGSSITTLIKS